MALMSTEDRQEVFVGYFHSNPAVLLDDYAPRFPEVPLDVRGMIKGTHFALATIELASDLIKGHDFSRDKELITKLKNGQIPTEDQPAALAL